MKAVQGKHGPLIKLLCSMGASWKPTLQDGRSAMHLAACSGQAKLLELSLPFVTTKAMDARDVLGNTALHYAVDRALFSTAVRMINVRARGDLCNLKGRASVSGTRGGGAVHTSLVKAMREITPFFVHYKTLLDMLNARDQPAPWSWSTCKVGLLDLGTDPASREDAMVRRASGPYIPDPNEESAAEIQWTAGDNANDSVGTVAAMRGYAEGVAPSTPVNVIVFDSVAKKWLQHHPAERAIFGRILTRIASGEDGIGVVGDHLKRALSKRLKGCKTPIWQAKFDHGRRILWTRETRSGETSIHVWGVLDHDDVTKYMMLIDQMKGRLSKNRATIYDDGQHPFSTAARCYHSSIFHHHVSLFFHRHSPSLARHRHAQPSRQRTDEELCSAAGTLGGPPVEPRF
jgi:hypothetical protein